MAFTETWLRNSDQNVSLDLNGFGVPLHLVGILCQLRNLIEEECAYTLIGVGVTTLLCASGCVCWT